MFSHWLPHIEVGIQWCELHVKGTLYSSVFLLCVYATIEYSGVHNHSLVVITLGLVNAARNVVMIYCGIMSAK